MKDFPPLTPESPAHGATILVIEGDVVVQLDIASTLRELGAHNVITATNGAQALSRIDAHHFNCALLDAGLGQKMMLDIAEKLASRNVPFAFTSSYGTGLILPSPLETTPVLAKPFNHTTLERLIAALLLPGRGAPKAG